MESLRMKIKRWGQKIKFGELHDIADEIKNTIINDSSDEINNGLAKLLLYICHVPQDNNNKSINGMDLFNISNLICCKITTISNFTKFYSSLYYISNYLMDIKRYEEAMRIEEYILPGSIFHSNYTEVHKVYGQFSCMWYRKIENIIATLTQLDNQKFELVVKLIKHELNLQTLSLQNDCKYLLTKVVVYCEKFHTLGQREYIECIYTLVIEHLEGTKLSLSSESKYTTYKYILIIVSHFITHIECASSIIMARLYGIFRECVQADEEFRCCFKIYEQFCQIFTKLLDQITSETNHELQIYLKKFRLATKKYGCENAMKWNAHSIFRICDYVCTHWEKCKNTISIKEESILISIIEILIDQSSLFSQIPLPQCYCAKSCCRMRFDINRDILLKSKVLGIISHNYFGEMTERIAQLVTEISKTCTKNILHLHRNKCGLTIKYWTIIGTYMYNIGARYEKTNYEMSIYLYSLLVESTIQLKAFDVTSSYVKSDNPLCAAFHRLTSTHYKHAKYDEAMISCALHAYVGYTLDANCKAFRMWTNIKYKYPESREVTIVDCLKSNIKHIQVIGLDVNLDDCQVLSSLCLREIKGLQQAEICLSSSIAAVLNIIMSLENIAPVIHAHGVQMLGYHMLNYDTNFIISNVKIDQALANLDIKYSMLKGHLMFYNYIAELQCNRNIIEKEMINSKIKLVASENENDPTEDIVPAYYLINISVAENFAKKMEAILDVWFQGLKNGIGNDEWFDETTITHVVIIAAEYTRFHQYFKLEKKAWKIAYGLAEKFQKHREMIWITGRCISSRLIYEHCIDNAIDLAAKFKDSTNCHMIEAIAMFKLSLSEYYFESGKNIDKAKALFQEAMSMSQMKFAQNLPTYLLSADITLAYKMNFEENLNLLNYIRIIVKGLYTMLSLDEVKPEECQPRENRLYAMDILFKFTNHISLRMNSLFSFREITAHLLRRLTIVQKLGSPLHVAECLKNLCFIDISRNRLNDCEVKLQGIEHILGLETYKTSMKSQEEQPICNIFENDTSPVLRKKVVSVPNFINHKAKCECWNCGNITYQYLIFSCIHIRAQLYAAKNYTNYAFDLFHEAFRIMKKLKKNPSMHCHHHIVEYVLFILDFARFLKYSGSLKSKDMALYALEMCERYKLVNHPVYFTAKEFIFEYRFENIFTEEVLNTFTVPSTNNATTNDQVVIDNITQTPVRQIREKQAPPPLINARRKISTIDYLQTVTDSLSLLKVSTATNGDGLRRSTRLSQRNKK